MEPQIRRLNYAKHFFFQFFFWGGEEREEGMKIRTIYRHSATIECKIRIVRNEFLFQVFVQGIWREKIFVSFVNSLVKMNRNYENVCFM